VLKFLKRLETEILIPWDLSAIPRSKWYEKGSPCRGHFTSKYTYLPERPRFLTGPYGLGIWAKLLAEIVPSIWIALLPISLACI
jgi:hypothetical protein